MRRLDRWERQLNLWLTRVVAFLSVFENTALARALHARIAYFVSTISACVLNFIAMRATWTPGYQQRVAKARLAGVTIRGMKRRSADPRAVLGGALRRALKAKTLKGRAEALLRVLKNRDLWIAYLARRIARGQTRIYSAHSRVAKTLPLHQPSLTLGWSPSHTGRLTAGATKGAWIVKRSKRKLGEELRGAVGPP